MQLWRESATRILPLSSVITPCGLKSAVWLWFSYRWLTSSSLFCSLRLFQWSPTCSSTTSQLIMRIFEKSCKIDTIRCLLKSVTRRSPSGVKESPRGEFNSFITFGIVLPPNTHRNWPCGLKSWTRWFLVSDIAIWPAAFVVTSQG